LPLVPGVIDHHEVATTVLGAPGIGDKAVRGPIVRLSGLRLDLGPDAVAKGPGILQELQQLRVKGGNLRVHRLGRTAAEMGRYPHPCSLELALMKEAQAGERK
jgi:hypothetical protein